MDILEAYDLHQSYSGAARAAGCDKNTVKLHVERRARGLTPDDDVERPSIIDEFRPKIVELVRRSQGDIRADVVHERLVALGFAGSERTTRRAVREAKDDWAAGNRRTLRPWITEPGEWLQFDWGHGPEIGGRQTLLWCAWAAWSRFRIVIPTWDRKLPTVLACLDETLRALGGVPSYVLTDNEKTITTEHIAGVPVRHPEVVAAGRHYGTQITTCVPADPQSKGGSEATVKIAKADLVPTTVNLRDQFDSFAELRAASEAFMAKVNHRPHRVTRRKPVDMLAEELARLHPVPADPYVAALGETRVVTRESVISLGGTRYSVPHQLIDQTVWVRVDGDEVVIAHKGEHGVREVARHAAAAPGNPQLDLSHYPERSSSRILDHTPQPRTPAEAAFLQLGPGATAWLVRAAAAGTSRVNVKMDQAVEFAAVYGDAEVDGALAAAAEAGRFAEGDLASILAHRRRTADPDRTVVPISEAHSLQNGTGRWQEVGR